MLYIPALAPVRMNISFTQMPDAKHYTTLSIDGARLLTVEQHWTSVLDYDLGQEIVFQPGDPNYWVPDLRHAYATGALVFIAQFTV